MALTERLAIVIDADGKAAVREFQKVGQAAERELGKAESKSAKVGASLTKIGTTATVAGSVMVAGLSKAAQKASDLEQAVGGTEAVFGQASAVIDKYAKGAAQSMGLSERAFRESTTRIGGALKGLGFDTQAAAEQSVKLTQIAADLAATYGGTTADAVQALGAAFRGEFDPAEQFNLFLKQSSVDAEAVALGLASSTASVDAHARAQATLSLIMKGSVDAQGRFAAESDTLAGKQARARAEAENASAALGQGFAPVLAKVADIAKVAADGFVKLDEATHGAASTAAAVAAVTLTVGGVLSTAVGQVLKLRDSYLALKTAEEGAAAASTAQSGASVAAGASMATAAPAAGVLAAAVAAVGVAYYFAQQRGQDFANIVKNAGSVPTADLAEKMDKLEGSIFGTGSALKVFESIAESNFGAAERLRDSYAASGRDVAQYDAILRKAASAQKQAQSDTANSAGAVDRWGSSAKAAADAAATYSKALTFAAGDTSHLAYEAGTTAAELAKLASSFSDIYTQVFGASDAQRRFEQALSDTGSASSSAAASSSDYESKLRRQEDATRAVADAESELADAIDNRNRVAAGPDAETVEKAQIDLRKAQRDVARSSIEAARANDQYNQALNEGDPTKIAEAQLDYNEARDRFRLAQLAVIDTQQRLNEIQNSGKEGSKEYADANDRVEQAQRRVEQAQRDSADAASALEEKTNRAGGAVRTVGERLAAAAQAGGDWLQFLIDSKAPAEDVAAAADRIHKGLDNIAGSAPGAKQQAAEFWDAVTEKVNGYYDALDKVRRIGEGISRQLSPDGKVKEDLNNFLAGIGVSGARALGGPVMGGSTYLVGERGPELFTPGTSGVVHPSGSFGGATIVMHNTFHTLDPYASAEAVTQAIKVAQRMGMTGLAA